MLVCDCLGKDTYDGAISQTKQIVYEPCVCGSLRNHEVSGTDDWEYFLRPMMTADCSNQVIFLYWALSWFACIHVQTSANLFDILVLYYFTLIMDQSDILDDSRASDTNAVSYLLT